MNNIEKKVRWFQRLNAELYYLIIINFVIIVFYYQLFIRFWELIELVGLGLTILLLLRKNSKIVYKLEFDDIDERLNIYYYQFVIRNCKLFIPYTLLNFRHQKKSYGIGNVMNTLVFLNSKKSEVEIREKNNIGWTKNEIMKIIDKLNDIKNEKNS